MFLYTENFAGSSTSVFESIGYSYGEDAGNISCITGVRGEMSGDVWAFSVNASGVTHPTPQRVHPNTQCFYGEGSDKLSTCLLYPTLSTPSEGFSKGGSNF